MTRAALQWTAHGTTLLAAPATAELVSQHSGTLATWYNHPGNQDLMGNTQAFTPPDVETFMRELAEEGGLPFLLFVDGALVGDADLRNLDVHACEFAIMVGDTSRQGQGLGTRFTVMLHVHAFRDLKLTTVVLSIVPHNTGARRCYEKAGYVEWHSPRALAACDDPTDVPMVLTEKALRDRYNDAWTQVTCT
jgi:RimJ/RimL family protein N-acetyltransferase